MQAVIINLAISRDELLRAYKGVARTVVARDINGRRIAFPVNVLQPFVSHVGVHGKFRIEFDDDNRFKKIDLVATR